MKSARQIIQEEALKFGVEWRTVLGKCRKRRVTAARHSAILRIREEIPSMTTTQLGRILGRDHSSVVHAKHSKCIEKVLWEMALEEQQRSTAEGYVDGEGI